MKVARRLFGGCGPQSGSDKAAALGRARGSVEPAAGPPPVPVEPTEAAVARLLDLFLSKPRTSPRTTVERLPDRQPNMGVLRSYRDCRGMR